MKTPAKEMPKCPAHLTAEARREWSRLADELRELGILSRADRGSLAIYCTTWGRWVEAERELRKTGLVVETPNGHKVQSPYLAIANKALATIGRLQREFGMTPAARRRHVPHDPPAEPAEPADTAGDFDMELLH